MTFLASFVLILYFDWLQGFHKEQNFDKKKKHSKIFSSENVKWMNPVLCIHVTDSSLYIICVFYSSPIRTLVAMVTLSFHRLIMGKVEISYFLKTIAAWDLKSGRCKQLMD